ncbi:CHU large protein [Seminavis robusta]|uniref:CHU large protein n=1 Tax=Seminavis robusta TaxID=568900 RepID=A0A9N8DF47_9STRA|nr:CHU large protein [Seminavis robusta]|eukprot:Sro65_g036550.1 CHU large protein (895) ;mRNA; f:13367-16051
METGPSTSESPPPQSPSTKRPRGNGLEDTKFRRQTPAEVLPGALDSVSSLPHSQRTDPAMVVAPPPVLDTANPTPPANEVLEVTAVATLVTPGEEIDEEAIRQQAEKDAEERLLSNVARAEVVTTNPDKRDGEDEHSNQQRLILFGIGFLLLVVVAVVLAVSLTRKEVIITVEPSAAPTTLVPSAVPSMAPSFFTNDFCRGSHEMQVNTVVRDATSRNTLDESVATCGDIRSNGRGQWFNVKGNDAWLRVHTCGSGTNYDTQLSVYQGGAAFDGHPCDAAVCVAGSDQYDFCGDKSYVQWFGQAHTEYLVLVHGYRFYTGDFEMEILEEKNGQCEGAFNISQPVFNGRGSFVIESSMQGAELLDSDLLPDCDDNSQKPSGIGVWYAIDGQDDSPSLYIGSGLNVAVYKGSCSRLSCVHVDDFDEFDREEGVTFYLLVYGNTTATETSFELSITWAQAGFSFRTPDNAYCEAVSNNETFALEPNQVGFQAWTPTTRFGLDTAPSCGDQVWHTSSGLWYSAVGTGRAMTVSTCPNVTAETPDFGRDFLDTQISVYTGSCDSLVCVDGNDQFCGDQSAVSWFTEAGVEYLILVHGYDSREGYFEVWYDDAVPDLSPSCQVAITISADGTSNLGSTISNNDTQSIAFCGFGGGGGEEGSPGSWYQAVGTGQTWTASTCSSNTGFSARVSVYEGAADCSYIACLPTSASESSPCGDQNAVTWRTIPNQTYYFLIHGQDPSASGDFVFTLEETSSNDNCEGTIGPLTVDDGLTTFGSTRSATFDDYVPTCGSEGRGTTGRGLFYSLIGTGENITASTCSPYTNFDMKIAVYFGSCIDLQCVAVKPSDCEVNEDGATYFGMSITWPSQPNDFYYLLVQGQDEETGNFGLEVFTAAFDLSEG